MAVPMAHNVPFKAIASKLGLRCRRAGSRVTYAQRGSGLMTHCHASPLIAQFGRGEDPRIGRTKLHRRQDLIVMSVCAVICGAAHGVEGAACC